jgi:hypothetical protein
MNGSQIKSLDITVKILKKSKTEILFAFYQKEAIITLSLNIVVFWSKNLVKILKGNSVCPI